jgi:hypothetical protein
MGKVEGKVCSQEGQKPSSNECRCEEEVVGVDEGALGSEEKGEGVAQVLTSLSGGSFTVAFHPLTMNHSRPEA